MQVGGQINNGVVCLPGESSNDATGMLNNNKTTVCPQPIDNCSVVSSIGMVIVFLDFWIKNNSEYFYIRVKSINLRQVNTT